MTDASQPPADVTLIVVNHDGEESLRPCVESLMNTPGLRLDLVLVDNASKDESPRILEEIERAHPNINVVRHAQNLGYAAAVNSVLPICRGRYVGVLNMDVLAEPGWLSPLVAFLDENPGTGGVNPLITLLDGQVINAAGQDIHITGLGFNHALGRTRSSVGRDPFPVSGLQGATFLIRRTLLEQMQGMDATGFLYHEDVNLSWLLQLMGQDLYCVPEAVVRHDYFLSMHAEKLYLLERNRLAMLACYLDGRTRVRLSPVLLLTEILLWSYALLRGPSFLRAKARSYGWVRKIGIQVAERRALAGRLRVRTDAEVLSRMKRGYAWRQFLSLARERDGPRKPLPPNPSARG
ncbi:MAG: glycosyltransferase family 2 protein [Myxococcota bacterium]